MWWYGLNLLKHDGQRPEERCHVRAPEEAASENIAVSDGFRLGSFTVKMRTYYSTHHIWAAAHFARMAAKIESEFSGELSPYLFIEHRAYVTASVLAPPLSRSHH